MRSCARPSLRRFSNRPRRRASELRRGRGALHQNKYGAGQAAGGGWVPLPCRCACANAIDYAIAGFEMQRCCAVTRLAEDGRGEKPALEVNGKEREGRDWELARAGLKPGAESLFCIFRADPASTG